MGRRNWGLARWEGMTDASDVDAADEMMMGKAERGRTSGDKEWNWVSKAVGTNLPISLSTAILFGLLGIGVDEASFGKVLGSQMLVFMLLSVDGGVVTVAELVGASHWHAEGQQGWPGIDIEGNDDDKDDGDGCN